MIEQIKKSVMLFNAPIQRVYQANRGTIIRTIIYTFGHFIIAASCVMYFTGASFTAAITAVSYTHLKLPTILLV